MAVSFAELPVVLDREVTQALRLATREAVNVGALEVTQDARRRVRGVLGPEQRMSRLVVRKRPDQGNRLVRVSADTIAKGGTRINPYYRPASSTIKPVALVGARGPAHLIEHDRRGGYDVRASRRAVDAEQAATAAELQAVLFGRTRAQTEATTARLQRPGAIPTPNGFFARVRPGPILRPYGGPITAAFHPAVGTIARKATDEMQKTVDRQLAVL